MARYIFYISSVLSLLIIGLLHLYWDNASYLLILAVPLILIGIYDITSIHNVLRNYPVIGHLRYMFEFIRPEIQQYFVATNLSGRPFNREARTLVYQRANNEEDDHPFGTEHDVNASGYHFAAHSIDVKSVPESASRVTVGGPQCQKPYSASRINISAMSFGALSGNAIRALNRGAKLGNMAHNTGEGSLSSHHLEEGGDIIWQIGTGYFGCRTADGHFDEEKFAKKSTLDVVKMIEIKISQGAKPSHGGVLPAAKISAEIAEIRGVEQDKDCISPPMHSAFSTPTELLQFIAKLRELTGGKPIGFKLAIGRHSQFMGICKAMLETGILPDFITVDGAEGGTGAAPLEYSNRFGLPSCEALAFVHNCLVGINVREKIRLISSGKVTTGFDVLSKISIGADMCNIARAMMFAVGCIQALRCQTNTCPTGVATQDPKRARAVVVDDKAPHVRNFHHNTMKSFLSLTGAMGVDHPDKLHPGMIHTRQGEGVSVSYDELFHYVEPGNFLSDVMHPWYRPHWDASSATQF